MRKPFFCYLLLFLFVLHVKLHGQNTNNHYIIYTFEETDKVSQHGVKRYYWVANLDSLGDKSAPLNLLLLSGFSKNNLDSCSLGLPINPYAVLPNASYRFSSSTQKSLDSLEQLIVLHRKLLQVVHKKWSSGQQESIKVYATPIGGDFCHCAFSIWGIHGKDYKGLVYIGKNNFKVIESFWKTKEGSLIMNRDYTRIFYNQLPQISD